MAPVIADGSFVFVKTKLKKGKIQFGHKLIIRHKRYGHIIKTVEFIDRNGVIWCRGENPLSVTTEQIGPISIEQILGRVLFSISPPQASLKTNV